MATKQPQEKEEGRPKKKLLKDDPVGLFLIVVTVILVLVMLSILGLALQALSKQ